MDKNGENHRQIDLERPITWQELRQMSDAELAERDRELMKWDLSHGWYGRDFSDYLGPGTGTKKPVRQPIPDDLRWEVFERDDFRCQFCGSRKFLAIDHRIPVRRGGLNMLENLQTLCKSCNSRKHAR